MPDSPDRLDIIIAGASFAGVALARALSQALGPGLRIALIDRAPPSRIAGTSDDPRASAISASSRRMLTVLGAWPLIADAAQAVTSVEITDSPLEAGIRPVLLTYETGEGGDGEAAMHIGPNSRLIAALAELTLDDPSIAFIAPGEAMRAEIHESGAMVELADGRRLACALVIAADGRRSQLREAAGIAVVGWGYGQTGIVTTIAHERPHGGRATQHFLPGGPFAILPLRGNRSCVTWSEDAARAAQILALDDARFLAELDLRAGGRLGALALAGPRGSWPLEMHLARAYVAPRLALIGDAAHGVHPLAGQGLNLALRDVAALAECIADGARLGLDMADITILERYARWRRFDSALSAAAFDGLNRLFSNDLRLLRSAREAGLGAIDRIPQIKRWLLAEAAGTTGELPRLLRGEAV